MWMGFSSFSLWLELVFRSHTAGAQNAGLTSSHSCLAVSPDFSSSKGTTVRYFCPLTGFSETRDSTETQTEATGALKNGRSGSEMRGDKVQYFSERVAFAAQELESFKSSCKVFRSGYKKIGCRAPWNNTVFKRTLLKFQALGGVVIQQFFATSMETIPTEERKENKTPMKFILQDRCLTRSHLNRHWETIRSALLMPS